MTKQTNDNDFTFFCPECNSRKRMNNADIGKIIECEECCEMVKVDYPANRPCPKCKKNIKLKAKVCKYCKQRVMPFVAPIERKPVTEDISTTSSNTSRIKLAVISFTGLIGGFAIGLFGTRAIARITQHCISGNADYLIGAILGIYLAIHLYRSKKNA